jgi:hypothetical protein
VWGAEFPKQLGLGLEVKLEHELAVVMAVEWVGEMALGWARVLVAGLVAQLALGLDEMLGPQLGKKTAEAMELVWASEKVCRLVTDWALVMALELDQGSACESERGWAVGSVLRLATELALMLAEGLEHGLVDWWAAEMARKLGEEKAAGTGLGLVEGLEEV